MAQDSKKGKYARELERIKQMRALNNMLVKGDVENALLSGGTKDTDPVSDNVVDTMLNNLQQKEKNGKDIELVDELTEGSVKSSAARKRHTAARKTAKHKKARTPTAKLLKMLGHKKQHAKKARMRH